MTVQIDGSTGVSQCQPNSVSQDDLQNNIAGKGPAFSGIANSVVALPVSTFTKLLFQQEEYDTAGAYDPVLSRFQPAVPGYYQISAAFSVATTAGNMAIALYKNGAIYRHSMAINTNAVALCASSLIFLNGTTDFVEVFGNSSVAQNTSNNGTLTWFNGFLARAA